MVRVALVDLGAWSLSDGEENQEKRNSEQHRLTLEALFIREIKPSLNTKDEYKNRELRIRF